MLMQVHDVCARHKSVSDMTMVLTYDDDNGSSPDLILRHVFDKSRTDCSGLYFSDVDGLDVQTIGFGVFLDYTSLDQLGSWSIDPRIHRHTPSSPSSVK